MKYHLLKSFTHNILEKKWDISCIGAKNLKKNINILSL